MMNYTTAMKAAICNGWLDFVSDDAVHGNGFKIFAYGSKLMIMYFLCFVARCLIAALFPITALIVLRVYRKNKAFQRQMDAAADADL